MNFTITVLPDEPIMLVQFAEKMTLAADGKTMIAAMKRTLDAQTAPVALIHEGFPTHISFEDILYGANLATNMTGLFKHPMAARIIFVTQQGPIILAAKGASSPLFGGVKIDTYPTLEAALSAVRQKQPTA